MFSHQSFVVDCCRLFDILPRITNNNYW